MPIETMMNPSQSNDRTPEASPRKETLPRESLDIAPDTTLFKCPVAGCTYETKSATGLRIHTYRKHTEQGQRQAREAIKGMNKSNAKKRRQQAKPQKPIATQADKQDTITIRVRYCPKCKIDMLAVDAAAEF